MKAIITGGCGFIGFNLTQYLLNNTWSKWNLVVIDDLSSGKKWNQDERVKYVYNKLEDKTESGETIISKYVQDFKPDVIFHLAAVPRVSYSVEYPYETTESNMLSTLAVLDAVRKHRKYQTRIIYSSSSSIYGGATQLPTPINYPANPKSPYAMQKWQGEEWCRLYAKLYGIDVACLRYFNVFGPHSYYGGAYSTVLSAWLYSLYVDPKTRPFLEGDGEQTRDFCSVENVCQANILAAMYDKDRFSGEPFNVAQGSSTSLLSCKDLLEKISGKKLDLEIRPERVGDVKHTLADIGKTWSILGYKPEKDFVQQVTNMAKWYEKKYRTN